MNNDRDYITEEGDAAAMALPKKSVDTVIANIIKGEPKPKTVPKPASKGYANAVMTSMRKCEYFENKYAAELETVRKYAIDGKADCRDLAGGFYAFCATLPDGNDIGVANAEMDGQGSGDFYTQVTHEGEFIAVMLYGTLEQQLQLVPLAGLYATEIEALRDTGWYHASPALSGGGTALEATNDDGITLLATDGDGALIRGREGEESDGWLVSLEREDQEGEPFWGQGATLAEALANAQDDLNGVGR